MIRRKAASLGRIGALGVFGALAAGSGVAVSMVRVARPPGWDRMPRRRMR